MGRFNRSRESRKGGILTMALLLFVMVTVAGAALLSMSTITRLQIVRQSIDVRLMIAAETGLESFRGRFTLVEGVQEDWSALLPTSGWNNIGTVNVNGISVQVQAKPYGGPEVLQAQMRGIASASNKTRAVEYIIRAANFADYTLYFGANATTGIGPYFKMVGTFYSKGNINLYNSPGIEFFGEVTSSGKVMNYPDYNYNFKQGFVDYAPEITIPSAAYGFDVMKNAALGTGLVFYSNTISIELDGDELVRTYRYRYTGTGTNYNHNHYQVLTERLEIPDNSVIYIESDLPPIGVDTYGSSSTNSNRFDNGGINLWGVLEYKRVTIAGESDIHVTDNISYQTLLDNPDLRRFANKKSDAALAYREMLGVVSQNDVEYETIMWSPLPAASEVTNIAGDGGHHGNQFSLDAVMMGENSAVRGAVGPGTDKELWLCGGIINGAYPTTALSSNFDRRNYDTDYRLQYTTPPYFLKAYNTTAVSITGTWRTYEL